MRATEAREPASRWSRRPASLAIVVAITLVAAAALYVPATWVADLGPMPDAGEYAMSARNLVSGRGFTIDLLGRAYPPRYPIGFPLLIAPAYWSHSAPLTNGIYAVVAFGVLTALFTYALTRRLGGTGAGVLAVLLLLLSKPFLEWNHQVMSETATTAGAAVLAWLVHRHAGDRDDGRRSAWLVLLSIGAVCGLLVLIRVTNGVLWVAACGALCLDARTRADWKRSAIALGVGPVVAAAVYAVLDWRLYGSALRTGYHYWVPYWHESLGRTFSLAYALRAPGSAAPGAFGGAPNVAYYALYLGARIFAVGGVFAGVYGAYTLARRGARGGRAILLYAVCATAAVWLVYSFYFYQAGRFLAPVVPIAAALSAVGLREAARLLARRREGPASRWMLGVAIWSAVAVGFVADLPGLAERSYLWRGLARGATGPGEAQVLSATAATYARVAPPGALVVTGLPLVLLEPLESRRVRIVGVRRSGYWGTPPFEHVPVLPDLADPIARMVRGDTGVFTDAYTVALPPRSAHESLAVQTLRRFRLVPMARNALVYRLAPLDTH